LPHDPKDQKGLSDSADADQSFALPRLPHDPKDQKGLSPIGGVPNRWRSWGRKSFPADRKNAAIIDTLGGAITLVAVYSLNFPVFRDSVF